MSIYKEARVVVDQEPEKPRPRLLLGIAVAVVMVGGVLLLPTNDGPVADDQPVVNELPEPTTPSAIEVAIAFVEAYGAFDVDRAASYLAADADLGSSLGRNLEEFRLTNRGLEAAGYQLILKSCDELSHAWNVRCNFDFHGLHSNEIGLGPTFGSFFLLTVRQGKIASVSLYWGGFNFVTVVWEPFAEWVADTYPDDIAVMYHPGRHPQTPRPTQESIELWEQRSGEYVEVMKGSAADYRDRALRICRGAHARLNNELLTSGMEFIGPAKPGDHLSLIPKNEEDHTVYEEVARRIMGETLVKLRAIRLPVPIGEFDHLYWLMEEFAEGREMPFTPTAEFWIHQIELKEPSLVPCTFALPA